MLPRRMSDRRPPRARSERASFTKIVATIGPATEDRIGELIDAGMSVARLNFSHGTAEEHARRVVRIRSAARERMRHVGILADLPGPKMRTGLFPGGQLELEEGQVVRVRGGSETSIAGEVLIDVPDPHLVIRPGHRIALADGQVEAVVESVDGELVQARVTRAGVLGDRKGVHLPDTEIAYELPTAKDREWIEFAREQELDFLGLSFVGRASEVEEVRRLGGGMAIVAKIERVAVLDRLDEILEASDGVMVARGDLGVELELAELPMVQKSILERAVALGRYSITATEMLESMIHSSRPTRAEVTDVANAVLDGTDGVMLSAETAVGEYPVEAVATMTRVALSAEDSPRYRRRPRLKLNAADATFSTATAMAAVHVANALELSKIICFTESGNTVRLLSRYRPHCEIVALCPNLRPVRQMTALAHVRPILVKQEPGLEEMLYVACEMLVARGVAHYGEEVVFVAGVPPGVVRSTNVMKLHRIGEEVKLS